MIDDLCITVFSMQHIAQLSGSQVNSKGETGGQNLYLLCAIIIHSMIVMIIIIVIQYNNM